MSIEGEICLNCCYGAIEYNHYYDELFCDCCGWRNTTGEQRKEIDLIHDLFDRGDRYYISREKII